MLARGGFCLLKKHLMGYGNSNWNNNLKSLWGRKREQKGARLKSASPLLHSTVFKITHKLDQSSEQFRVLLTEQRNPSVDRSDTEFSESSFILYSNTSANFFAESAAGGIVHFNWTSARCCLSTYIWAKGGGGAYSSYNGRWSSECVLTLALTLVDKSAAVGL